MDSIEIFPWNSNFDTGIAQIDEQHRRLASLLNLVAGHLAFQTDLPGLDEVFDELASYAVHHFQSEELIWHATLPDDALELGHKRTHEGFVERVAALRASSAGKGSEVVADEVLAFLCQWLVSHIMETDRFMALVVRGVESGLTVEAATVSARALMAGSNKVLIDIILTMYASLSSNTLALMRQLRDRRLAEAKLLATEAALRQSQKMEAVGQLAGGVAHDFNNLLSVILGCTELALPQAPPGSALVGELGEIEAAALRAAGLTRQLLAFSRRQVLQPRVVDLNEALVGMDQLLGRVIGADVTIRKVRAPGLWPVLVDPSLVEQIVMNLVVNARDALPKGGSLWVETANVELSEAEAGLLPGLAPGPHVMLVVRDSGIGMSAETRRRIFEPFFTTKALGSGTGLGLAVVQGAVAQSGGAIAVESTLGEGTTFRIYFPRARQSAPAMETEPAEEPARGGSETIMLAEDDPALRRVLAAALRGGGYSVLEVATPAEAIEASAARVEPIDLLVTDVIMPELNGRELAGRLVASRPGLKVLFISGYTGEVLFNRTGLDHGTAFLAKPVIPERLLRSVRQVLDGVS